MERQILGGFAKAFPVTTVMDSRKGHFDSLPHWGMTCTDPQNIRSARQEDGPADSETAFYNCSYPAFAWEPPPSSSYWGYLGSDSRSLLAIGSVSWTVECKIFISLNLGWGWSLVEQVDSWAPSQAYGIRTSGSLSLFHKLPQVTLKLQEPSHLDHTLIQWVFKMMASICEWWGRWGSQLDICFCVSFCF